jgi:hypothetical protein
MGLMSLPFGESDVVVKGVRVVTWRWPEPDIALPLKTDDAALEESADPEPFGVSSRGKGVLLTRVSCVVAGYDDDEVEFNECRS